MAERGSTTRTVKRRGILAAARAVVAGIAAKQGARPVAALTSVTLANGIANIANSAARRKG